MFVGLYKKGVNIPENQDARRKAILEEQRKNRIKLQDENRGKSKVVKVKTNVNKALRSRNGRTFKDLYQSDIQLQLSEWLRDPPEELWNWLLVPCPRGQRCMVVACNGRTEMFSKSGRRCFSFASMLPGDNILRHSVTIIDCIYEQNEDILYVLDGISFGKQSLLDCEAQFRFFWLRSKLAENDSLSERSTQNEKPFRLLQQYDFEDMESIMRTLQSYPLWPNNQPELDGFLFYHKESNYSSGKTPLVGWLFPFMVPDILDLKISSEYERPPEYENPLQFMEAFDIKVANKRSRGTETTDANSSYTLPFDLSDPMEVSTMEKVLDAVKCLEMEGLDYTPFPPTDTFDK